ncbi:MAG: ADP-ribosylglycohydrolase family protein [Desulfobacterales bacterium]
MNETDETRARFLVLSSFAADALALGAHWIYDPARIRREFGRVQDLTDPRPPTYHPHRKRGEFTHYGDQALVLLRSLAERGGFDEEHFSGRWRALFQGYTGYVDSATRRTLENLAAGMPPAEAGSDSGDLGGAARIAPLAFALRNRPDELSRAVRRQTALTHRHAEVVAAAALLARLALEALAGKRPTEVLSELAADPATEERLRRAIREGLASATEETLPAILRFGQACGVESAFPATVHLIARYEENPVEGLIENVMAGGDSAARGLAAGMVFGAWKGAAAVRGSWVAGMKAAGEIEELLDRLERVRPR